MAAMSRDELVAELLAERYGAPIVREQRQPSRPNPADYGGGADTDIAIAQRRRVLCDALDDHPHDMIRRVA